MAVVCSERPPMESAAGPSPRELLRRRSDQHVLLRLRRRAARMVMRASRIATLRLAGLPHEEARARMELSVAQYRQARGWLTAAVAESAMSDGLLTVDQALVAYGERHVLGVVRVGLMKERGDPERVIREHLAISEAQFGAALEWWRDATAGADRSDDWG